MTQFEITNQGIPRLSAIDIETRAEAVIKFYAPDVLRQPCQTPLTSFVDETSSRFKVRFDFSQELGMSTHGHKIMGLFRFHPRTILIDRSLLEDIRFPFVLAHEFGHFVLHRNLVVRKEGYSDINISDIERDFVTGKKILLSSRDWLEWQANRFASALLIPQTTVHNALVSVQKSIGINSNVGLIYVDDNAYSLRDLNMTLRYLQERYQVSRTNMEYRLNELGMLIDRRNSNIKHISELLMED